MEYREFGNTGIKISRLGFGAMRLPYTEINGKSTVDEELSIQMIHRAFNLGVNYIDTAYMYCDSISERVVGKALKGWRDKVWLSTKFPHKESLRETLEEQLTKLDTDHIDFYHLHGIGAWFLTSDKKDRHLEEAAKAKEEGLIRHLSFSFHDQPEVMIQLIDMGIFSSVLCQYNIMNRSNEPSLAYAKKHGVGTVVMGPVAGGMLAGLPGKVAAELGIQTQTSAELALRFVFANPDVNCAISGMSTMEQVEENVTVANNTAPLSPSEVARLNSTMDENRRLAELYCTNCKYCVPHCPQEVNIPQIFNAMNLYRIYGIENHARNQYGSIGANQWNKGKKADACIECGVCESHCPQKIEVRKQLKECREFFGK